jgi:hypothetical protein
MCLEAAAAQYSIFNLVSLSQEGLGRQEKKWLMKEAFWLV